MSKVTFQIPANSPVQAKQVPSFNHKSNSVTTVQNWAIDQLLDLGYNGAYVEYDFCNKTSQHLITLKLAGKALVTARFS